ncbi:MAG: TatD family hydrolase [Synergistaceae bacterium]|nr:TatD family hydrolase [Synergistaceae bacterium]
MFFIDAHCHINSEQLRKDAPGVVRRAVDAGVKRLLVAGCDAADSAEAVELTHTYENEGVYAAVGVHPHEAKSLVPAASESASPTGAALPEELLKLADDPRAAAIGETGLDYYYDHSPRSVQRDAFRLHIAWAERTRKPLVIHVRDALPDHGAAGHAAKNAAMEDALSLLREAEGRHFPLLFHCYAGGLEYLDAIKELDAYISIGGPVTWPKNKELREAASRIPEERLLCETDAPWLTPQACRGKLNEPAYVRFVYEAIAELRGLSADELARVLDANAARLFGWGALYGESDV